MATLANILNQFIGAGSVADATPRSVTWETSEECKLRALPNEDVYLFTKRIDNSRVVRQADPRARARDWKFSVAPHLQPWPSSACCCQRVRTDGRLSTQSVADRKSEAHNRAVPARSAGSSIGQRRTTAGTRENAGLHRPAPDRTVYLEPKNDKSLALNRH